MRLDASPPWCDSARPRPSARVDRLLLRGGAWIAPLLPAFVMPLVVRRIRRETRGVVLPAEDPGFARHLRRARADAVRINVNLLGESILCDAEAEPTAAADRAVHRPGRRRLRLGEGVGDRRQPRRAGVRALGRADRRSTPPALRRAAVATPRTFVNLDMEEYRDLELTVQSFMRGARRARVPGLDAGIVLQAYLPDSHDALERAGRVGRGPPRGGRWRDQGATGQGRQPGDGDRRGRAARLDRGARTDRRPRSTRATRRCSSRPCDRSGPGRCASESPATTCSTSPGRSCLRRRARRARPDRHRDAGGDGAGPGRGRCTPRPAVCCCTHRSWPTTTSRPASPTSSAASTRTPQPENFLRALFTMEPGSRRRSTSEASRFRAAVEHRRSVRPRPAAIVDGRPPRDPTDGEAAFAQRARHRRHATPPARAACASAMRARRPRPAVERDHRGRRRSMRWSSRAAPVVAVGGAPLAERRRCCSDVADVMCAERGATRWR